MIITRASKGSALTYAELDGNFLDLKGRTDTAWMMDGLEPSVRDGSGNPAELTPFYGNLVAYSYVSNAPMESFTNWDVPFDWATGTDLYLAFHWSPGNSTATGTVRWGIDYIGATVNGTFFAPITEYYNATADGVAYKHLQVVSTPFPGNQAEPNMRFLMRIFRDGASIEDTFPDPAFLIGVDFYYQRNKFGQATITPPYS